MVLNRYEHLMPLRSPIPRGTWDSRRIYVGSEEPAEILRTIYHITGLRPMDTKGGEWTPSTIREGVFFPCYTEDLEYILKDLDESEVRFRITGMRLFVLALDPDATGVGYSPASAFWALMVSKVYPEWEEHFYIPLKKSRARLGDASVKSEALYELRPAWWGIFDFPRWGEIDDRPWEDVKTAQSKYRGCQED